MNLMSRVNMISINLEEDFAEILRNRLIVAGYSVPVNDSPEEVCFKYLNALRRRINPNPRVVLVAKGFSPEPHTEAIETIKHKAEIGEDLTTYQSRRIARAGYNDRLFNAWDVHHFHLGTTVDKDGFISQDDPLLFARVTFTHFYMIGIFDHSSFAMQRLVEILLANWPESISGFRYKDTVDVEGRLSDKEIRLTRDEGIDTSVRMPDGTVYDPMGGGITMSGRNVHAVIDCMRYCATLERWQEWLEKNIQIVINAGQQNGFDLKPPFYFRLVLQDGRAYAVETNSSFSYFLNDFPLPEIPSPLP
jgi:hypothetical protein